MRRILPAWCWPVIVGLLAGGCSMLSVNPFFSPRELAHDPALAGVWTCGGDTLRIGAVSQDAQFRRRLNRENSEPSLKEWDRAGCYRILYKGDDQPEVEFLGMLGAVGPRRFLQVIPFTEHSGLAPGLLWHVIPMYSVWRVDLAGDRLVLDRLDSRTLLAMWKRKLVDLDVQLIEDGRSMGLLTPLQSFLTSPTEDLTRFLLDHGSDDQLFVSDQEMTLPCQKFSRAPGE
jgi:hypothetical protein